MTDFSDLWEHFPRTQAEFDRRFRTEADCRTYLIKVRWNGQPRCKKCDCARVCSMSNGRFQCLECGHQTSVTSGTILDRTRKPLRLWFRALFELLTRKTGISAKDLQRLLGFGSYETAWTWLHKLRALLVTPTTVHFGGRFKSTKFTSVARRRATSAVARRKAKA